MNRDFRKLTSDEVRELLEENYTITDKEWEFVEEGYFKYNGYSNNKHRFIFIAEDPDLGFCIVAVYVFLGPIRLEADYAGISSVEGLSYEEAVNKFDSICN